MGRQEVNDCKVRIPNAVKEASFVLAGFTTGAPVAEVKDCALDQLGEWTVYLTPTEFNELEVDVERYCYATFNISSGSSDSTDVTHNQLVKASGEG